MLPSPPPKWGPPLLFLVLAWLVVAALLQPTFMSMYDIWDRSETYAHGFVILPISLWLIWRDRQRLAAVPVAGDTRAFLVIVPLALGWLAARLGGVLVVEQYAFVALWIATVWLVLGFRMLRAAMFPLGFLLLMVPNGEALIQPLISFTADFTVGAVRLVGIPVYREGPFFTMPTGEWNVVEGCSGLRYLIASITLGVLYAYLTYRTPWKRVAFSIAAMIVPVFANGMRATIIVFIAHYSDMKLALGVDHFIYGWVWFGLVMLVMFWVGLFWREDLDETAPPPATGSIRAAPLHAAALALLLAVFPIYEGHLASRPVPLPALTLPTPTGGWQTSQEAFSDWLPQWHGMDVLRFQNYRNGDRRVLVFVAWYGTQRDNAELINSQNIMIRQKHPEWRQVGRNTLTRDVSGQALPLYEARLLTSNEQRRILAWQWHRIKGEDGVSPYLAKIGLALTKLLGGQDSGAAIIVATPYRDKNDADKASAVLAEFLAANKPALDAMLDKAE
ncbi:MAG: exosortase A [Gallionellaceae bacterium]|nr:exosortase A [Gallionellaceae bacterium]